MAAFDTAMIDDGVVRVALAGPGGTGLPGTMAVDAANGVGQALQGAAQGIVSNACSQHKQTKEQSDMAFWLQQAVERHQKDWHGWDVINSAIQYGGLSAESQAKLCQQFKAASRRWQYTPAASSARRRPQDIVLGPSCRVRGGDGTGTHLSDKAVGHGQCHGYIFRSRHPSALRAEPVTGRGSVILWPARNPGPNRMW